jgi:hypothetical protein
MSFDSQVNAESKQIDPEKEAAIKQIRDNDRLAFETWVTQPDNKLRLDIPHEALRILIPQRIFELSEDPINVDIVSYLEGRWLQRAIIFERRKIPLSDRESLKTFISEFIKLNEGGDGHRNPLYPQIPEDIDAYHIEFRDLINEGALSVNDYITNFFTLDNKFYGEEEVPLETLVVGEYEDRAELRGKGVATSFYTQLRDVAKQLGYRAIMGSNNEQNISYFTGKLGRLTLDQLPDQNRKLFQSVNSRIPADRVTIDFLYPEDKEQFTSSTS